MKVEIKERPLKGGNRGLYLEYYEKGFRKRENLHLYLIPDNAPHAKTINRKTYLKAMAVRSDRILNPPVWDKEPEEREDGIDGTTTWLEWCDEYIRYSANCDNCKKMMQHKTNVCSRINEYLDSIGRTDILLKDVTTEVISGLYEYMRNEYKNPGQIKVREGKLADFTLLLFGETINAIFNKALRDGRIGYNPVRGLNRLERFHWPDKHREFLTPDELVRFLAVETATENERQVQIAFGFSCMTGLRLGDMQRLRWEDIKPMGDGWAVSIVQHKTGSPVTVPLNELALSLLPPRPENDTEKVFHLVKKADGVAKYVRRISEKALNFVFLLATPLTVYFILFAEYGVYLLSGDAFTGAILPMQVIMPTLLLIGITNILGIQILVPLGREKVVLCSEVAGAVVDVIINALLIPRLVSTGAAIGTLVAEAVVLAVQYRALRADISGMLRRIHYGRILIGIIIGSLLALWVPLLHLGNFLTLLISAVMFFGGYGIFMLLVKEALVVEVFQQVLSMAGKVLKR